MQNESISWGWTLPISTIKLVYCAEIMFQSVPGTSKEDRGLSSTLFKKWKLIVLITSVIHENWILRVFLNQNKPCNQSYDDCSVWVYLFIVNKSTTQDMVSVLLGKTRCAHTYSAVASEKGLFWVMFPGHHCFSEGSQTYPKGPLLICQVCTALNLR